MNLRGMGMRKDSLQKKNIVFGTGNASEKISKKIKNIEYYVDNDQAKWGKLFLGKKIYSPEKLLKEEKGSVFIVVASMYYLEIAKQLQELGFEDYINGLEYYNPNKKKISGYIETSNQIYSILKGVDPVGRIFINKKTKQVYRGIFNDFSEVSLQVYKLCEEYGLFGKGLIETKLTNLEVEPFDVVFEHRCIESFVYPFEWSPLMLKDAGVFVIELMLELDKAGLGLKDGHPFNVAFNNGSFKWYDFGSIILGKTLRSAINEFISTFVNPLMLMSLGYYQKAITNMQMPLSYQDIYGYLNEEQRLVYEDFSTSVFDFYDNKPIDICLRKLKEWVQNIEISKEETRWSNYRIDTFDYLNDESQWNRKESEVISF